MCKKASNVINVKSDALIEDCYTEGQTPTSDNLLNVSSELLKQSAVYEILDKLSKASLLFSNIYQYMIPAKLLFFNTQVSRSSKTADRSDCSTSRKF